jgi:sigma-B regulation protein RsbU (phosphoserine phosphatase)
VAVVVWGGAGTALGTGWPVPEASTDRPQILIADDQPDVLDALRLLLHPEGFVTESAGSPTAVVQALQRREFDLLLMDLNYARDTTSGREGLDLLTEVHAIDGRLPVVVMTGWASMEVAIEALRAGVRDFVQKPWDNDRVVGLVRALSEERRRARHDDGRRAREMREAAEIQQALLPRALPCVPGWSFAAACQAAAVVGGDTYDLLQLPGSQLGLSIADVAGKGIPAALLASSLQSAVRSAGGRGLEPAALCDEVNRAICERIPSNRFVTFFYALVDTKSGRLRYTNAGHNPPLLVRAGCTRAWLSEGGPVLGIDAATVYRQGELRLEPGDRLVLYTDGIVEARNPSGDEFGSGRLESLCAAEQAEVGSLLTAVLENVRSFADDAREDDQTVVVVARVRA